MDSILPNKEPYRPQINQITTIVYGKPIYFDELVRELKQKKISSVKNYFFRYFFLLLKLIKNSINFKLEMRKQITEVIQEEIKRLKQIATKFHEQDLKSSK
jgi:hypothetical protein